MRPAKGRTVVCAAVLAAGVLSASSAAGQVGAPARPAPAPAAELVVPADYVIGPDDVLSVVFWDDAKMTADVVVRPDGKITLPLLNDIVAAGLTPEQLKVSVTKAADPFFTGHNVMVRVKEIKSRFVTIVGEVANQGPIPLGDSMTVLQLIGRAGGLSEFASRKNILIIRKENGRESTYRFNYSDVSKGKNLRQNIELKPGDTVVVP